MPTSVSLASGPLGAGSVTTGARRLAALHTLSRAVWQSRRAGSPGVADRLRAVPRMVLGALTGRYQQLSRGRLVLITLAIGYLVSPVDLVPELFLAVLGLADDAVVALWLAGVFVIETERFLTWERARRNADLVGWHATS